MGFVESFKSKPLGIKIISILFFCLGIFFSCFILTLAGVVTLPLTIAFFTLSVGIFRMRQWAHIWTGILLVAWVFLGIGGGMTILQYAGNPQTPAEWLPILMVVLIAFIIVALPPILIYLYLKNPKVREMFK